MTAEFYKLRRRVTYHPRMARLCESIKCVRRVSSRHPTRRGVEHGSQVVLDPNFLLTHALYIPGSKTIIKSHMTLGQAVEAIAFAHIKTKKPELGDKCNAARTEFTDGKFILSFADTADDLSFRPQFLTSETEVVIPDAR